MSPTLNPEHVERARRGLERHDIGGWLLYDFRGKNAMAGSLLGLPEGQKRRYFVLLRPEEEPVAVVQKIEVSGWEGWPYELRTYLGWRDLEAVLGELLDGLGTVAMEVSPRDSIPYVDNVPAGVVELVESLGPRVVSSVDLISGTAAQWGARGRDLHRQAARILARTARRAFELAARAAGLEPAPAADARDAEARPAADTARDAEARSAAGLPPAVGTASRPGPEGSPEPTPSTEHDLAEWIRRRLGEEGLAEADTIVAVGPNSAKPHYEPRAGSALRFEPGQVFMVDLWGKVEGEPAAIFADQTWMGFLGPEPPGEVAAAWAALVEAREAAIAEIRGTPSCTGADADRAARAVLIAAGHEEAIFHRTGHGIDTDLHGVGPTLDSIEMRDDRRLVPGVGFSVEPGLYFEGRFGLRTEVDVYMADDGPEVTPARTQTDLWSAR